MKVRWRIAIAGFVGFIAGGFVRGFLPPFVVDDPLMRELITSPAAAGLFALAAAGVAYLAALKAARTARQGAERQEWWERAEWALDLARSDKNADRLIGLRAIQALADDATEAEAGLILAVTTAVTGDVDTPDPEAENRRRRWWW